MGAVTQSRSRGDRQCWNNWSYPFLAYVPVSNLAYNASNSREFGSVHGAADIRACHFDLDVVLTRVMSSAGCHVFSRQHAKVRRVSQALQTRLQLAPTFLGDHVFWCDVDNPRKLPLSPSVLNSILDRYIL